MPGTLDAWLRTGNPAKAPAPECSADESTEGTCASPLRENDDGGADKFTSSEPIASSSQSEVDCVVRVLQQAHERLATYEMSRSEPIDAASVADAFVYAKSKILAFQRRLDSRAPANTAQS